MKKVLIINTHKEYEYSPWKLTKSIIKKASDIFSEGWFEVKHTNMEWSYDVNEEIEKHLWADFVFVQIPVNWMGVSWTFKKYIDEVYSAWMIWTIANWDGRSRKDPSKQYGSGGLLTDKKYMFSTTFNAPADAFDNKENTLFEWASVDDMLYPNHLIYKFFGFIPMKTFNCFDVIKNPNVEGDFKRLEAHIKSEFYIK